MKIVWIVEEENIIKQSGLNIWERDQNLPIVIFFGFAKHISVAIKLQKGIIYFDSFGTYHQKVCDALCKIKPVARYFEKIQKLLQPNTVSCGGYGICFAEEVVAEWQKSNSWEKIVQQVKIWTIEFEHVKNIIINIYKLNEAKVYQCDIDDAKIESNQTHKPPKKRKWWEQI